jgi:hypothetical protein
MSCGHKFIFDDGVYDTLESKTEQVLQENQEEKIIVAGANPLDDFFQNLKI